MIKWINRVNSNGNSQKRERESHEIERFNLDKANANLTSANRNLANPQANLRNANTTALLINDRASFTFFLLLAPQFSTTSLATAR